MAETVIIRRMEKGDLLFMAELERESFTVPWPEDLLAACLNSRFDKVWVLVVIEKESGRQVIAGYCNFRVIAGEGELMRIAVKPSYRGRGFSRKLMEILVSDARINAVTGVTLEVRISNIPAVNLYKAWGFVIEAVRKNYYTHPTEDALIMWKRDF